LDCGDLLHLDVGFGGEHARTHALFCVHADLVTVHTHAHTCTRCMCISLSLLLSLRISVSVSIYVSTCTLHHMLPLKFCLVNFDHETYHTNNTTTQQYNTARSMCTQHTAASNLARIECARMKQQAEWKEDRGPRRGKIRTGYMYTGHL
jgi:hypothetical protein